MLFIQITLAKEREGNNISIWNGHEEWFHNGFMEVTEEVKRQRQRLMLSHTSLGLCSFLRRFIFVCGKQINPSIQPKLLCFPEAALHKRSACCVGGENWKKQGTDRANSSNLATKNESWQMQDFWCYIFSLCRCYMTQQESLPFSLPLQHPAGWHVTAWCPLCLS